MENVLIMLDENTEKMVERIAKKVNLDFNSNVIDIDAIFNLLSSLEDEYDDLKDDYDDLENDLEQNYKPISKEDQYDIHDCYFN